MLEEQRIHLGIDEVVDRHHVDLGCALQDRLQALAPDASETVDANANRHYSPTCCADLLAATARSQSLLPSRPTTTG